MTKNKWLILFSTLLLCVGVIGPVPVLADDPPPFAVQQTAPGRNVAPAREFNRTPSQPVAACTVPSAGYTTIAAALADPACDPILVSAGVYSENLIVERPVTIQGDGAATTAVDGGGLSAVFAITNTAAVTLTGLTIQNGAGYLLVTSIFTTGVRVGGGVFNHNGYVTIQDSVIYSNTSVYGGGVYNTRTARIENTDVVSNTSAYGGGVHNEWGNLTLSDSTINGNIAQQGGGVHNYGGDVTVDNCTVSDNAAWAGGGVDIKDGSLTMNRSTVSYNLASGDPDNESVGGGLSSLAISRNAVVVLNDTAVTSNTVSNGIGGGGIANHASVNTLATLTLNDSLVQGNVASSTYYGSGFGGGIRNGGNVSGAPPTGPAVATVTLNNSTVRGNRAVNGGGIGNGTLALTVPEIAMVTLNNSTVNDNTAAVFAGGTITQTGNGGGVFNVNATLSVVNSTVSGNHAQGQPVPATQSGLGGGIANASAGITTTVSFVNATVAGNSAVGGGGVGNAYLAPAPGYPPAMVRFSNSIVAGNTDLFGATGCLNNPGVGVATLASQGYNLEDSVTCGFSDPTDLPAADPLLGPLADNGGGTLTHALLEGSPAIDAIPAAACTVPTDQRGLSRPQGPACDVGAYEKTAPTLRVIKSVVIGSGGIPIPNGDFESGHAVWTESSALGNDVIFDFSAIGLTPHTGRWSARMGGSNNEDAYIEQQALVPADAPYLVYWHWIDSGDLCGDAFDVGTVRVNGTTVDQYFLCAPENTGGWVSHVVDLSAYAGQSVTLRIGAKTDAVLSSSLYVDDVAFQASPVPPEPADVAPLGGEVTYSIIVQNSSAVLVSGVTLTDELPAGVVFGTGIITGSVIFPAPDTLTWGPWDVGAGETHRIYFTAVVTDSTAYYGRTITNTVDYTSGNAGSGSAEAAFTIMREPAPLLSVAKSVAGPTVHAGLPNGDFESGVTVWAEYSALGYGLILTPPDLDVTPHGGSWAAWLGGDDGEVSYIEQQVTVPASDPRLVYWHWIYSEDVCGYDFGAVLVDGTVVDVYDLCEDENTDGWVRHAVDLSTYAGQSVMLQIRAETDDYEDSVSSLYVDDVSFSYSEPADDTPLGGVVTYTIAIKNDGTALASGVTLTDTLPPGVTLGTGIITGSVVFPAPDTLTWGPWDVGIDESYTICFTAVVTDSQAFAGRTITNTVDYTSIDVGGGLAEAAFTIAGQEGHYIYLPLVMR